MLKCTNQHNTKMPPQLNFVLLIAILSVSISPLLIRFAGNPGLDFAFWRSWLSVLLLLPFLFVKKDVFKDISKKVWIGLITSGVLLGLHFYLWILSLSYTSVASSTVIVTASPIFTAIFAHYLLKETLDIPTKWGIAIGFVGTCLLAFSDVNAQSFPLSWWGNVLSFLGMLCIVFYLLIGRKVRQKGTWLGYVFVVNLAAALTTTVIALWLRKTPLCTNDLFLWTFIAALFPSIIGHGGLNYALKFHNPSFIGLLILTEPLFSGIAAFFIWNEAPTQGALLGMLFILIGVAYPVWKKLPNGNTKGEFK